MKDSITIRADGKYIAELHVGSRAVLFCDESWQPSQPQKLHRRGSRGTPYTETVTLQQRLVELCGERAGSIYGQVAAASVVTICDEYAY